MHPHVLATALLVSGCAPEAALTLPMASAPASPGVLVVDFVDGTLLSDARSTTALDLAWVHPLAADESLALAAVPDLAAAAAALRTHPLVEVAEPVIPMEALGYPDDPMWKQQWNMRRVGVKAGWRAGGGTGVTVAVIDTGVSAVPDLDASNLLPGISVVPGQPSAEDGNGHGTHVAGTIAQATNNGLGVVGVAPGAALLPVKALTAEGSGQSPWIAAAIDEAADNGADIINLSLGGRYSAVIANAVKKAQDRGVLIIAAAGNTGREGVSYPAALPGVVGVSAVGPDDGLAHYSSWGDGVDIAAPGGDTRRQNGGILQDTIASDGHAFKAFQGTSMAAPHVAGAAAVLWRPAGGDIDAVLDSLLDGAEDLGASGLDPQYGHGRLSIPGSLRALGRRYNAALFGIGGLAALLLAGLGGGSGRGRRSWVMVITGAISAGGIFILPMLPVAPSWWTTLLSRPLLQWPASVLPDILAANPLTLSAFLPGILTFILGPTRTLGPVVAGICAGVGAHMLWAAGFGGLEVWPLEGWQGRAWRGVNGALTWLCAVATVGIAR
ncbi:MAG: S8 family serine peptidase, partial [Myxococcota bacterium]|nr:S8 family serine peptidase [Myxococcota bacterium]